MRTKLYIIALLSILSIAGYAVSYAPAQGMQSTSSMRTSGSVYTPQVTEVGSVYAASEATTTDSYSPSNAPDGRKFFPKPNDPGNQSDAFPIGDAVLPLLLMAMVYGVWCMVYKRKRRV